MIEGFFAVANQRGEPVGERIPGEAYIGTPGHPGVIDVYFRAERPVTLPVPAEARYTPSWRPGRRHWWSRRPPIVHGQTCSRIAFFNRDEVIVWDPGALPLTAADDRLSVRGVLLPGEQCATA